MYEGKSKVKAILVYLKSNVGGSWKGGRYKQYEPSFTE
jgi:hypothetical protein